MQTKTTNKLWALALSLIMLLTLIPVSAFTFSTTASAAENSHVLESGKMAAAAQGTYKDGQEVKYDDYFTIYMSAKTKIDSSAKEWKDDGYTSPQRLNFGGKGDVEKMKNLVSFKTANPATVKLWFVQGGDDNRQMAIWDASGAQVAITNLSGMAKNGPYYTELKLAKAGTYFLGGATNNNNIYKVEVAEEAAAAAQENTFESSKLTAAAQGAYKDGQEVKVDDFFTLYMSAKTKIDSSKKDWADDGYSSPQRLNFGGKGDVAAMKNLVSFKTGAAATVKIWFVQGGDDNRQMAIWDASGAQAAITNLSGMAKNGPYYAELKLDKAGTYFLGGATNNNNIYKVTVVSGGGAPVARGDWSKVAAPSIESVALNAEDKGKIDVTVKADISANGGDKLSVIVLDKDGKEVDVKNTVAENTKHVVSYAPKASGKYTFSAKLIRDGETDKTGTTKTFDFTLPLGKPTLVSATSQGNGKIKLVWQPVDEATGYKVYIGGKEVGTSSSTEYLATGLTVGNKYSFTVAATRASEVGEQSAAITTTATKDAKQEWGFTAYGTSTGSSKNKYEGNLNEGKVTVIAQGGAGKLNLAADDGYSFYYTAIPANKNFTFRAKLHVDEWTYSNGQEGFGIAAVDSLPEKSFDTSHWTNFYMAAVGRYDPFKAQQGVGVMAKTGITPENWQDVKDNKFDRTKLYAARAGEPLDAYGATATSRYNIVGNVKNPDSLAAKSTNVAKLVDFDLEITKNNTGFFCSYYKDGKLVKTQKHWGTEELSKLDKDYIYVGIVAARNFTVSLKNTDYTLEIRDPAKDPAPEAKPTTYVEPKLTIESGEYGNSTSYDLLLKPSHKGTVTVKVNGEAVAENKVIGDKLDSDGNVMEAILPVTIKPGKNPITVDFKADTTANLGENVKFSKTTASANVTVDYNDYFAKQENIYVAPGAVKGNGGKDSPYDLATAVTLARPGQKIILKEGTYKLNSTVLIPREVDGTKDAMIYLMADPEAKTRPVLDFKGASGIGLQVRGDYWYLKGFDVTHATSNGLRIDGNYCVADQIHAYYNTSTGIGIQIDSKFSRLIWPTYNTVKNCDSYYNADPGEEDADGFSAKFCIGVGNVFDNCVAYGNADDGWDLYGRNYPMEAVTVQNCVAYKNGYREDGSRGKGNGNGFKLGGDNNAARHVLINSVSFMNGSNGITNNSNPNIIIKNSISYKNDGAGIALSTKAGSTDYESKGVISYKNGGADSVGAKGSQDMKKVDQTYWNGANGVADNWFKSLEFSGKVARKADGSIDMQGFLELTDKAPKAAGARMEAAKSGEFAITPDEVLPNPVTGSAAIPVAAAALAITGAAILVASKKRKK